MSLPLNHPLYTGSSSTPLLHSLHVLLLYSRPYLAFQWLSVPSSPTSWWGGTSGSSHSFKFILWSRETSTLLSSVIRISEVYIYRKLSESSCGGEDNARVVSYYTPAINIFLLQQVTNKWLQAWVHSQDMKPWRGGRLTTLYVAHSLALQEVCIA